MAPLYERYRPRSFDDVIGQERAVKALSMLRKSGFGGRAIWISGPSGTGKTTLGRLVSAEVADNWGQIEIDATGLTVAELEKIERRISARVLGKGGWGVMVNEAHALTTAVVRRLLVMLERIPAHVVWIFTTTIDGQAELFDKQDDTAPLLSRCNVIPLAQRGLCEAIAQRTMEIARAEGLDGKPLSAYVRLTKDNRNNMRANLSQVEAGAMMAD